MTGTHVHEIEAVERAALEDLSAAADRELVATLAIRSRTVGTAFACVAGALPDSAIVANRAIGLGASGTEREETVEALLALYAEAGVGRYFVHLLPDAQPAALAAWLEARGLEPARAWVKFRRAREAPPAERTDLDLREATAADAEAFGRIEADAFDLGPDGAPWLARLVGRPGWHIFMSFDGDAPAGAGALFVRDGIGWLDWGATAPAYRGRGGQSALLARRITAALDLGCHLIGTTTGEEVPGDPQVSYHNIVKSGFEPAYLRANWALPKRG